jgi:hypothetical protein
MEQLAGLTGAARTWRAQHQLSLSAREPFAETLFTNEDSTQARKTVARPVWTMDPTWQDIRAPM